MQSWQNIGLLVRYWLKGRFSRSTAIGMLFGEIAISAFALFAGSTFLSFSTRFGESGGTHLSEVSWGLVLSFYLIGLIQAGFGGYGLPISSADVDYVFTSPLKTTEVFAAKVLQSSTTLILSFPPIFILYLSSAMFYNTPYETAIIAGLVTLLFFIMGLVLSADVTLALSSNSDKKRITVLKYFFAGAILTISLLPLLFLVPGISTSSLSYVTAVLPSGVVAQISVGLVSGLGISLERYVLDFGLFIAWFLALLVIGTRLSRRQFYEVLQISDPSTGRGSSSTYSGKDQESKLDIEGRSVWSVIVTKERIVMKRAKEGRGLLFSALILSVFLAIYALAGAFTSSPTSFLFILFIIGSFGTGNAWSWMEKERLWILKTSTISLRRYVKEVFLARATLLLSYLTPAVLAVGALLVVTNQGNELLLLRICVALAGALEIAAITMGGSMYFASKYAQSSGGEMLSSQGQDISNLKRMITQTAINFLLVAPVMLLVYSTTWIGAGSIILSGVLIGLGAVAYAVVILNAILGRAGDTIARREDL